MLAENSFMLERFSSADEINYYNTCKDIMLAGENYKVLDIKYFIKNIESPLADYVSVKTYDDEDSSVSVRLADDTERADVQEELKNGGLDEYFKEGMFLEYSFHKDTKVFIMRVNGRIAGYLRAENCYSNIYDIGWIYVLPEYRGHSYGAYMVSFFTEYLFNMGCIPQYGFAINPESAKIAEKCGYKCSDERAKLTVMCLKYKESQISG